MRTLSCTISIITVLASTPVGANDKAPSYESGGLAKVGLVAAGKAGVGLGVGALGHAPVGELELGYLLPFLDRSLQFFVAGQYANPATEGQGAAVDARLPQDGVLTYRLSQRQLMLTSGLLYRIPVPSDFIRPYVALGGRVYLVESTIDGTAGGVPFPESRETATSGGFYGALGAEVYLGPGGAFFEVQSTYAPQDGFILRDTHASGVYLALGYRLFI